MNLLPHFLESGGQEIHPGRIVFGDPVIATGDRKRLSHTLHDQVTGLYRSESAVEPVASASDQQIR